MLGNCHSPHATNQQKSCKRHSFRENIKVKPALEKLNEKHSKIEKLLDAEN